LFNGLGFGTIERGAGISLILDLNEEVDLKFDVEFSDNEFAIENPHCHGAEAGCLKLDSGCVNLKASTSGEPTKSLLTTSDCRWRNIRTLLKFSTQLGTVTTMTKI
jgi:hypothetical protein